MLSADGMALKSLINKWDHFLKVDNFLSRCNYMSYWWGGANINLSFN